MFDTGEQKDGFLHLTNLGDVTYSYVDSAPTTAREKKESKIENGDEGARDSSARNAPRRLSRLA